MEDQVRREGGVVSVRVWTQIVRMKNDKWEVRSQVNKELSFKS